MVVDTLSEESDVFFVRWTNAGEKMGRQVRLDEHSRIIPLLAWATPVKCFADMEIALWGPIGGPMGPHRVDPERVDTLGGR